MAREARGRRGGGQARPASETKVASIILLAAVFALVVVGLLMVFSASSADLSAQGKSPIRMCSARRSMWPLAS